MPTSPAMATSTQNRPRPIAVRNAQKILRPPPDEPPRPPRPPRRTVFADVWFDVLPDVLPDRRGSRSSSEGPTGIGTVYPCGRVIQETPTPEECARVDSSL